MNRNKIRRYAVVGIISAIILAFIIYTVSNSSFNFKGNTFNQKPKTGLGYMRMGRQEFSSPETFFLGNFTANMAMNDRSGKFVCFEVRLKMSDTEMVKELKDKNIVLRDAVIEEMSLHQFSEVSTEKGKLALKEKLKNRLNKVVSEGDIEEVYFTKFIIQ